MGQRGKVLTVSLPSRGHPKITHQLQPSAQVSAPIPGAALSPEQGTGEERKLGENESSEKLKAGKEEREPCESGAEESDCLKGQHVAEPGLGQEEEAEGQVGPLRGLPGGAPPQLPCNPLAGHGTAS